jgi:hypothetical protein
MTVIQKKKIIQRIIQLEADVETLKQARIDAAVSGFASATISTAGGSKSYTRLTPDKITEVIDELLNELAQLRSLLVTGNARPLRTIATIYV